MRPRSVIPVALLATVGSGTLAAHARPAESARTRALTIGVAPNPIFADDSVLVFGRLRGLAAGGKRVVLHRRLSSGARFRAVQHTVTDAHGFYEFVLAEDTVTTNQSWFVTAPGPSVRRSRTVHERVQPLLTLQASAATGETNHPITFTGQVTPARVHVGEQVLLQQLNGSAWGTIATATIAAGSNYTLAPAFPLPGDHDLRVKLAADASNTAGFSDPVTLTIEQAQRPYFTINASSPTIVEGQSATISGTLYKPGSTTPAPSTLVTLSARPVGGTFAPIATTLTGADGSYSFTESPIDDEIYQVGTTLTPPTQRATAALFVGVAPAVSLTASTTSAKVGQTVTFSGTVTPDEAGHVVYLERLGRDGAFHVAQTSFVGPASTYQFEVTAPVAGTQTLRAFIPGSEGHLAGESAIVTLNISGTPRLSELPSA